MQIKFAHELVTNEGRKYAFECAVEAGYAKDRARITASELQNPKKYPLVVKYIGEISAEVARGKAAGLYIEQKIIRTGKLDDLSAEELESRMKEIVDEYSPILEGVEAEDITKEVKKKVKESRLPKLKKLN